MWPRWLAPLILSLAIIGSACSKPAAVVIPSCPQPSPAEILALRGAVATVPDFAELERKRIVHCCRLEVVRRSDRAGRCVELLQELAE